MRDFQTHFLIHPYRLYLPKEDREKIDRYVLKQQSNQSNRERVPFARQVDFWAFCIVAALAKNLAPLEAPPSRWGKMFIQTSQKILTNDLCSLLIVIAVAKLGHNSEEAIDPKQIIDLANRLAGAGCSFVLKELSENTLRTTPLDRLVELVRALQGEVRTE